MEIDKKQFQEALKSASKTELTPNKYMQRHDLYMRSYQKGLADATISIMRRLVARHQDGEAP